MSYSVLCCYMVLCLLGSLVDLSWSRVEPLDPGNYQFNSSRVVISEKSFLESFAKFMKNTCARGSFLIKLRAVIFPVGFVNSAFLWMVAYDKCPLTFLEDFYHVEYVLLFHWCFSLEAKAQLKSIVWFWKMKLAWVTSEKSFVVLLLLLSQDL